VIVTGEPTGLPATDAAVIEQSWAEPEQFEAIFRRYFAPVHRYLAARVGSRIADDLAAEVFTAAFAQRQRYDLARDCARPWLYGIATHLAGTYRRTDRAGQVHPVAPEDPAPDHSSARGSASDVAAARLVDRTARPAVPAVGRGCGPAGAVRDG